MKNIKFLLIGLFISQISVFGQTQNFNNGTLQNVNKVQINDPGPEEGIQWSGTAANWSIDVSPEDRTNADGNLNLYGTANNIMLWRPTIVKSNLEINSSGASYSSTPSLLIKDLTNRGTMVLESLLDKPTDFLFKNNGEGRIWFSSRGSSDDYSFNIYTNSNGTGGPDIMAMTIKQDGNIGIGTKLTSNPKNYRLAVNGLIGSKGVKVENVSASSWPDYVFSDSYVLADLSEVDNFIKNNSHLPNIPSAKEVEKNGIELADMDSRLLRKIEELTLYMIEQNNKTESLVKKIELLESENEVLKEKITKIELKE